MPTPIQAAVDAEVVDQHVRAHMEAYSGPEPEAAKARLTRIRRDYDKARLDRKPELGVKLQSAWETYWAAVEHYETLQRLIDKSRELWQAAGGRRRFAGAA